MKRFLLGAVATVALSAAAFAADLPARTYTKAPAVIDPAYNWAGLYIGGDAGVRWSRSRWTTLDFDTGTPPIADQNPANLDKTSFFGGGYIGYNWMLAPAWLVGVEADVGWGGGTATHTPFPGILVTTAGNDFVNVKLGWSGSARGRLGYLVAPNWLVYGTAGVAWQQINTSASCNGAGLSFCGAPGFAESSDVTKAGWTAGGGIETMLWGNWIGRAQYLYADLGTVSNRLPPAPGVGFHANIAVKTNTAVLGLAYKF